MYKRTSLCLDVIGIITQFICEKKTFFDLYSLSKATRFYYHHTPFVTKNIIFHLDNKNFSTKEDIKAFKKLDLSYVYYLNLKFRKRKAEKFINLPLVKAIFDLNSWFFDVFKGLGVLNLSGQYISKYVDSDEDEYSIPTDGLKFRKFGNFLRNISKLKNNSISVKFFNGFFEGGIGTVKKLPKNYLKDFIISSISSLFIDFYISTGTFITLLKKLPNLKALYLIKKELDDTKPPFPIVLSKVLFKHKRLKTFKCRGNMKSKDLLCIPKVFPELIDLEYYIYSEHSIFNEENGKIFAEQLKNLEKLSIYCDDYDVFPFSKGLEILNNALLFPNLKILDVRMQQDCFENSELDKVKESYESLKFNYECYNKLNELHLEAHSYIAIPFFAFALKTFSKLKKFTITNHEDDHYDFIYEKNCKIISSLLGGNGNAIKSKNIEVFDVKFPHVQRDFVKLIFDITFCLKFVKNIDFNFTNVGNEVELEDLEFEEYEKWKDNITLKEGNKLHNVVEVSIHVESLSLESFLLLWNNVPNIKTLHISDCDERDSYSMFKSLEGIPFSYNKQLKKLDFSFLSSTLFVACLCNSQVEKAIFYHDTWDFEVSDLNVISTKINEFPQLKRLAITGIKDLGKTEFFNFAFDTMKNLEETVFDRISIFNFVKVFEKFRKLRDFDCEYIFPRNYSKFVSVLPLHQNILNINIYGTFLYERKKERKKKTSRGGYTTDTKVVPDYYFAKSFHKIEAQKDYVVEQMLTKFINLENLNLPSCIGGFPEFSKILKNIKRPVLDKMKVINLDAKMGECTFDDINLILKKFPNLEELEIMSRIVSKKKKVKSKNFKRVKSMSNINTGKKNKKKPKFDFPGPLNPDKLVSEFVREDKKGKFQKNLKNFSGIRDLGDNRLSKKKSQKKRGKLKKFKHKKLKVINFGYCEIGSEFEKKIKAMIKTCVNLKKITLLPWNKDKNMHKKLKDFAQELGRKIDFAF